MERRTALALAAAAAATVLAGSAAFAANVGMLEDGSDAPVGQLDATADIRATEPVGTDPTVVTIVVEDPPVPGDAAAVATPGAGSTDDADDGYEDDDRYEGDDGYEDDDRYEGDDPYEDDSDDEHESEGSDDHDD